MKTNDDIVLCVDCKYYVRTFGMWLSRESPRCSYGRAGNIDLVTGKVRPIDINTIHSCAINRQVDEPHYCGPSGKHWVPRKHTSANTFKVLKRIGQTNN